MWAVILAHGVTPGHATAAANPRGRSAEPERGGAPPALRAPEPAAPEPAAPEWNEAERMSDAVLLELIDFVLERGWRVGPAESGSNVVVVAGEMGQNVCGRDASAAERIRSCAKRLPAADGAVKVDRRRFNSI